MADPIDLTERTLSQHYSHRGRFLTVRDDVIALPNSEVAKREFVDHPGSVMIVAFTSPTEVVIEKIYRYPVSDTLIELPAGMLEIGEASHECAKRELLEETGYTAGLWAHAGKFFNAPAYSSETIDLWIAKSLSYVGTTANDQEPMAVSQIGFDELVRQAREFTLNDMRTACAILIVDQLLSSGKNLNWMSI